MTLYTASYVARKPEDDGMLYAHRVDVIHANDPEEAWSIGLYKAKEEWPDTESWVAHDVRLMPVHPLPEPEK